MKSTNYLNRLLCALMLCTGLVLTGCYDDTDLRDQLKDYADQLDDHESRLNELERICTQANTNIEALQAIVLALQAKDYVVSVTPVIENGVEVGYQLTFEKGGKVTIYHGQDGKNGADGEDGKDGQDGKDGKDGQDGYTPVVSVRRHTDGIYYWTIDGKWLTDSEGNMIQAVGQNGKDGADGADGKDGVDGADGKDGEKGEPGVTPKIKIEDGKWYVSVDNGQSWEYAGEAVGEKGEQGETGATGDKGDKGDKGDAGDSMFSAVDYISNPNYVIITLSDGVTQIVLPRVQVSEGDSSTGSVTIAIEKVTATTVTFKGHIDISEADKEFSMVSVRYSKSGSFSAVDDRLPTVRTTKFDENGNFTIVLTGLNYNTIYKYCVITKIRTKETYSEKVMTFTTANVTISVASKQSTIVSSNPVAEFIGTVTGLSEEDKAMFDLGIAYNTSIEKLKTDVGMKVAVSVNSDGSIRVPDILLSVDTKYYYCSYMEYDDSNIYVYGEIKDFQTVSPYNQDSIHSLNMSSATDMSSYGSANCYIVSQPGLYKFKTVTGNTSESVGSVASASILWETFGTSEAPECFDLIKSVCYKDGYVAFQTSSTFKEGNAVIAAKDASGKILWSWHIWLTDQPEGQVYFNNAGTMMDRNLGATSATPGDVGALGLLYQWGRKDPFLGSSSISSSTIAESTIAWPSAVKSDSSNGTIAYATANPITFITSNSNNYDWYFSYYSNDNTRWTTSDKLKSIYDPCPSGWRVPDGGLSGVWAEAKGYPWSEGADYPFHFRRTYSSADEGVNFSGTFGSDQIIWYPASGCRYADDGSLDDVANRGVYWSASPSSNYSYYAYSLRFDYDDGVSLDWDVSRARGKSVRCIQE